MNIVRRQLGRFRVWKSLTWVATHHCTSRPGQNFLEGGWHPYTSLLDEIKEDDPSDDQIEASEFYDFYKNLKMTENNWSCLHAQGKESNDYWDMPWGTLRKTATSSFNEKRVIDNAKRLFRLRASIREQGYRPRDYAPDFACGVLIVPKSNLPKFIIFSGNHRIAVCRHLKIDQVLVRLCSESTIPYQGLLKIKEADMNHWPNVVDGKFSVESAKNWLSFYQTPLTKEQLLIS